MTIDELRSALNDLEASNTSVTASDRLVDSDGDEIDLAFSVSGPGQINVDYTLAEFEDDA